MKKFFGGVTIILGVVSCSMFFSAGSHLNTTGRDMNKLKSQGGTSLAEVYYQEVGEISKGIGKICYALGVGSLTISIGLGANLLKSDNKVKSDSNCNEE
jgi:hypothetical protein